MAVCTVPTNTSSTPPRCVPGMRPRPHPHAVRDCPMYVDCGTMAGQGGRVPTCDHPSPESVGGWGLWRPGQPPHPTHDPTKVCTRYATPTPPARRPRLSYVCRLRDEGGTGGLRTNM